MASEKAKLIASAVRGGTVFVYAASSKDPVLAATHAHKTLNKMETSSFECSDCGSQQHVVASASPEPYCVTCGSDRVIESNRTVPETAAFVSDDELASITCGACATENVMPLKAVKAAAGCMHCVTCGGELAVAEDEESPKAEETADGEPQPEATPAGGGSADLEGEDDFPAEAAADDSDPEAEAEDDDSYTEESTMEDDGSEDPTIAMGEPDFGAEAGEMPNFSDMGAEEPGNEEELFLQDVVDTEGSGEPLIDAMELNDTPDGLEFMSKAGVLLAMKGAHVVAFARERDVGTNADILHSPEFAQAVVITAQQRGTRKALARMGFQHIRVKPTDVKAGAKAVAQARLKFAEEASKKDKIFADSLAIASVGMAKGIFKDFKDPIRSAVEAHLSTSQGARTAKVTASRIMADNGMDYAKSLIQLANKLSGMTEQVRKEYAEMLDLVEDGASIELRASADEMPMNEEGAEFGDEDVTDTSEDLDSIQSRLTTTAVLLRPKQGVTASGARKANVGSNASAILAGSAPLRFNF
jgi:hypothetical protein